QGQQPLIAELVRRRRIWSDLPTSTNRKDVNVRRHGFRYQRTLARPATVEGIGFLTGALVHLRFVPAPVDTGAVFLRTDLPARPTIAAHVTQVTGTARRTTIGTTGESRRLADSPAGLEENPQVGLVEHVLA